MNFCESKAYEELMLFSQEAEWCYYQLRLRYLDIQRPPQFVTFFSSLLVFRRC